MTRLTGTVTNLDGRPVAEAAVHFVSGPVPLPDIAQITGSDGTFSLAAPSAGCYRLRVRAAGHEPVTLDFEVADEAVLVRDVALR